jgi:alpha-mannosidase
MLLTTMKTVHLIFNAHLDPIWLWPWQAGTDEALATCRSACDRLDRHPTLMFSQGEAWIFREIEQLDPALFARIRTHVASGRWEVVNGWWTQPDCNQPSGFGCERQIALGLKYFRERFGIQPRVGYNIDSFGHAATLPGYMHAAGQHSYVMMRPGEHEMKLPANLFRWRGYEGGPEIATFRIPTGYCQRHLWPDLFRACFDGVPEEVGHTMLFLGVGDHGGGPTEGQIAWIEDHRRDFPALNLEYSTPRRFFKAIRPQLARLPLVTGELQMHAVGCYTVHRPVKTAVRRAEHRLRQAEIVQAATRDPESANRIERAWKRVCIHHFHDTLGGTCIPSAYGAVLDQLGGAAAEGDEIVQHGLRRLAAALPDEPRQRLVLMNASDRAWAGYCEYEPWLEPTWRNDVTVLDEQDRVIPHQRIHAEAVCDGLHRMVLRVELAPGQVRALRLERRPQPPVASGVEVTAKAMHPLAGGIAIDPATWTLRSPHGDLPLRLDLLDDASDTWSHGLDRYPEGPVASARWEEPCHFETGPLMASASLQGRIGESRLEAEWRVYAGEPFADLRLRVTWVERRKLLKFVAVFPTACSGRTDGIPGGDLVRPAIGRESPLRDWTRCDLAEGVQAAVVCPDVFATDGDLGRLRLTLLRSPIMAHHDPHGPSAPRMVYADQGEHEFRFRFFLGRGLDARRLDDEAAMFQRPLTMADVTRGMPSRFPA